MKFISGLLITLPALASTQAWASNSSYLQSIENELSKDRYAYLCEGYLSHMSLQDARAKVQPNETIGTAASQNGRGNCLVLKRARSLKS